MAELLIDRIARLQTEIAQAEAQRALVAQGRAVVDVWRDGRRVRYQVPSMAELEEHLRVLRSELYEAQTLAGQNPTPRRRAIDLGWIG